MLPPNIFLQRKIVPKEAKYVSFGTTDSLPAILLPAICAADNYFAIFISSLLAELLRILHG